MIQDVDESLRALVKRDALNGSKADVAFDAPTKEWSSRRNTPTVDLYLYDIREDLEQREVMWESVRDDSGFVTERRPPARRFQLSYLVTAWTQRPEDEHRLLASLLQCFLAHDRIPDEMLAGGLTDSGAVVALSVGVPAVEDRQVSDLWTAIGGGLRPGLRLGAVAPMQVGPARLPAPVVLERTRLRGRRPGDVAEVVP